MLTLSWITREVHCWSKKNSLHIYIHDIFQLFTSEISSSWRTVSKFTAYDFTYKSLRAEKEKESINLLEMKIYYYSMFLVTITVLFHTYPDTQNEDYAFTFCFCLEIRSWQWKSIRNYFKFYWRKLIHSHTQPNVKNFNYELIQTTVMNN